MNATLTEQVVKLAQEQMRLQAHMNLRHILEDSGLPPCRRQAIREHFLEVITTEGTLDLSKLDESIEIAQEAEEEAARLAEAASNHETWESRKHQRIWGPLIRLGLPIPGQVRS